MIKRLFLFITVTVAVLSACTDNDSFSADRSAGLSFSLDTLRMDTMFSAVPSTTYNFWVYNRSGDGLRISSVRLERGNQTGFRVNVDGTYLNPVATDLELRKDDSLRVFVEVTPVENYADKPQLVTDNLLFLLESGREEKFNLRTWAWDAEKLTDVGVDHDMTIESAKPVVIYGDSVRVRPGATLTVRNTTLYFHDGTGIAVEGSLVLENSVLRGDRLDHMFDYLPYDRVSGQWPGVKVYSGGSLTMNGSELHSSYDGIVCEAGSTAALTASIVHNTKGHGLFAEDATVSLDHCVLSNTQGDCLSLNGGTAMVDHCTLAQFYPFTAYRGAALRFGHTEQKLVLTCSNTLVTGYEDDVLMGEPRGEETAEYTFQNCLLRTPEVTDDAEAFQDIVWEKKDDEAGGKKHFLLVDEENLKYDFTIVSTSPCYEKQIGHAFKAPEEEEASNEEQDEKQEEKQEE